MVNGSGKKLTDLADEFLLPSNPTGHDKPTLLLTNQLRRSATKLIDRYAQRMLIENGIADGIDFFHMDALSSAVAMKVNCDPPAHAHGE